MGTARCPLQLAAPGMRARGQTGRRVATDGMPFNVRAALRIAIRGGGGSARAEMMAATTRKSAAISAADRFGGFLNRCDGLEFPATIEHLVDRFETAVDSAPQPNVGGAGDSDDLPSLGVDQRAAGLSRARHRVG